VDRVCPAFHQAAALRDRQYERDALRRKAHVPGQVSCRLAWLMIEQPKDPHDRSRQSERSKQRIGRTFDGSLSPPDRRAQFAR